MRARAISTLSGESGDPKSPHFYDRPDRYSRGDLRDVYSIRRISGRISSGLSSRQIDAAGLVAKADLNTGGIPRAGAFLIKILTRE